jgi:hypothetical protein
MNMIELTQSEKAGAIEDILDKGLRKPRSNRSVFREIHRLLGYRFIFWDTAQAFVVSAITFAGVLVVVPFSPAAFRHAVLFGCAPLLFIAILFFTEVLEHAGDLYELKLTCKYTIRQITAFRIMCYSLLGIIFCAGIAGVTAYRMENVRELLRLFPLSLCALFICAFIGLFFMRRSARKSAYVSAAVLWGIIAFVPVLLFGERWELFLSGLPVAVTLGIALLSGALFLLEIKKFMNTRHKEATYYAVG